MELKKKTSEANKKKDENADNASQMPFNKSNYLWVIVGVVLIALGFILMAGGGSDDPNVFNDSMFGFRRLTLAPILCLLGFAVEIYAIMKK